MKGLLSCDMALSAVQVTGLSLMFFETSVNTKNFFLIAHLIYSCALILMSCKTCSLFTPTCAIV